MVKKMVRVERTKGEKRMNRMECVRMNMEEDNGRERGEEKQEKNGNRMMYGNKEENRM